MTNRIKWLSVLRGLNILLVILVHVQLIDFSTGDNHLFCSNVSFPFHPIRMPLFIFISGGLLYISRIRKNIPTKQLYKDKFQRIVLPFIFFVNVYFIIKVLFNNFTKTPVEFSLIYYLKSFIYFRGFSSQSLWFLAVLMELMLIYPFFCYLCKKLYRMILFLIFCCIIYFVDSDLDSPWNILYIMEMQHYLIYFFFGILFFRYNIYRFINKIVVLPVLILLYIVSYYYYYIPLFTSILGILMMCAICINVANFMPNCFSSFRDYIYQIYLMSLPFQTFVELVLWKHLFYNEQYFYVFYLINVLSGLYIPILISKVVKRCNIKLIRLCFGLQ